jgi:hypothetical protein
MDLEISHHSLLKENADPNLSSQQTPSKDGYKLTLGETLFDGKMKEAKVLAFKEKAPAPKEGHINQHRFATV